MSSTGTSPNPITPGERVRHPLALRRLTVSAVRPIAPAMVRVTFTGSDLEGFAAPAPADHVKVFFPDGDGVLTTPIVTEQGIARPTTGTVISRDYTPFAYRAETNEVDIDFVLHGDNGPASAWAARAVPGMQLAVAGPRGSHLPPTGIDHAVIVADETALPAASRWLDALAPRVPVTALLSIADARTADYLGERPGCEVRWFDGEGRDARIEEALRQIAFGGSGFAFLAGEAGAITPLRRYLRRELGLGREQVDAHGYWKHGVVDLDHHAPLDPSDPD